MSATMTDETTASPSEPAGPDEGKGRRGTLVAALVAMAVVGLGLAAFIVFVADESEQPTVDPVEYTVAPDTGSGLTTGEVDDLVPPLIRLQPNQELVLVNNDWQPHTLGDLQAEQGETVRISYPSEGRHVTATSLRGDGRLTILVEDTNS
jgi:hypothetical protein